MHTPLPARAYAHINIDNNSTPLLKGRLIIHILLLLFTALFADTVHGQCTRQIRRYADFQGKYETGLFVLGVPTVFGNITNDNYAVDGNAATASSLNIPLGLTGLTTITQFLEFTTNGAYNSPATIAAGTPVTVKFSIPSSVLGLLDGIEIGTFTGLHTVAQQITGPLAGIGTGGGNKAGYNATNTWASYSGTTLLNALSGAGDVALTVVPGQNYHGLYVKLSGNGLSLALSNNIFHAYIMEDATGTIGCDDRIDVLSGVKGNPLINLASATGSVTNPWNAIDTDPAPGTYALLNTGVQVLSSVFETVIFNTPSITGDSVSIVIQSPGGGLLDLSLLTGFSIQPYLDTTRVGPALVNSPSFLSLRLLPGSTDKYVITAAVNGSFDRVEITMGGIASALASLRIYDVSRIMQVPVTTISINGHAASGTLCLDQTSDLTLGISPAESCATYTWYNAGHQLITTGVSANGQSLIPVITTAGTYQYYVQALRNGCSNSTAQSPISITVNALPEEPVIPPVTVCIGQAATLAISNPPTGITYAWYSTATGGTALSNPMSNGTSYTTGVPPAYTTYYAAATNTATGCVSSSRGTGTITIVPKPGGPSLTIQLNP